MQDWVFGGCGGDDQVGILYCFGYGGVGGDWDVKCVGYFGGKGLCFGWIVCLDCCLCQGLYQCQCFELYLCLYFCVKDCGVVGIRVGQCIGGDGFGGGCVQIGQIVIVQQQCLYQFGFC